MFKKYLAVLFFCSFFCFFYGQKVKSIYVLNRKEVYDVTGNKFSTKDSIILYKNKIFKRVQSQSGFGSFNNRITIGEWKFSKRLLFLTEKNKYIDKNTEVDEVAPIINKVSAINLQYLKKYKKVK